ncbi:hypothetical protein FIU97_09440 [Roseivivax sp. THAF40]|nr:hypothetical protein FIU97_09440 [Roseivivax sp. THAF40]
MGLIAMSVRKVFDRTVRFFNPPLNMSHHVAPALAPTVVLKHLFQTSEFLTSDFVNNLCVPPWAAQFGAPILCNHQKLFLFIRWNSYTNLQNFHHLSLGGCTTPRIKHRLSLGNLGCVTFRISFPASP